MERADGFAERVSIVNLGDLLIKRPAGEHRTEAKVAGQLVYAVGDIHGCYELGRDLLSYIRADCELRAQGRRPVLIFLGDYIDRGPRSKDVLEAMVWLQRHSDWELHMLKGNHEQCLLSFLEDPTGWLRWLKFGGAETLQSYNIELPSIEDAQNAARASMELLDAMPASHHVFLQNLETFISIGDYAFVHAGVRPGISFEKQILDDLLWIRDDFVTEEARFERVVVHGHTWRSNQPEILPNRICVDTGAYETGVLTAVCIEDGQIRVLQVAGRERPMHRRQ